MDKADFQQPEQPRFPHAKQFIEVVKTLPWPDWTGDALRREFKGIKAGGSYIDGGQTIDYLVDESDKSDFRPDYWAVGRIIDKEDHEFMERYLSTRELGTSDTQVTINGLAGNRAVANQKIDLVNIANFERGALGYEKEEREFLNRVHDGYADVLAILNWAKVLDESKRQGIPVEKHPEFEDFSLEGFIVSKIEDARGIGEQINDEVQNSLIIDSVQRDPTGINLLQLRENAIRSRLAEEGENPDLHPWLMGFRYGKKRFEQMAEHLLKNEDMAG